MVRIEDRRYKNTVESGPTAVWDLGGLGRDETLPEPGCANRRIAEPHGRVLGGTERN